MIIVAVLGALLLGVMGFLFVQRRSASVPAPAAPSETSAQNTNVPGTVATGDAACVSLTGEAQDGCYMSAAATQKDVSLCEKIGNNTMQRTCQRFVTVSLATERHDVALCATLAADEQFACENRVFLGLANVAACDAFSDASKEHCRVTQILLTARSAADCGALADTAVQQQCVAGLQATPGSHAIDRDGDGLSDLAETTVFHTNPTKQDTDGDTVSDYDEVYTYKTNPLKKDTDGDGFADNIEIQKGFNPNGPGAIKR